MKKIDSYVNLYQISKTLKFSLIPIGKTEENFNKKLLLNEDKKRFDDYIKVKSYIDRYHRAYIESVLSRFFLNGVNEYAELYYKKNKNDKDVKNMENLEASMRKSISKALTSTETYKNIGKKELIEKNLPEFLSDEEERRCVEMFRGFTTYFSGFNKNRENMYSDEAKSTSISYRCINDNLPKFLDNAISFKKIEQSLPKSDMEKLNNDCMSTYGVKVKDVFDLDYFTFALSQSGIDRYNGVLGGYTCSDGTKVQGINEYVNLYNQKEAKNDKIKRLPLLKVLYKQILSEKESISFIPEKFSSDDELIASVKNYCDGILEKNIPDLEELFNEFESYDSKGIFIISGTPVMDISNKVFGYWGVISENWEKEYEEKHPLKKGKDSIKYYENQKKEYKNIKSFSLYELQRLGNLYSEQDEKSILNSFGQWVKADILNIKDTYNKAENILSNKYKSDKKLCVDTYAIDLIKNLLDSFKTLERTVKPLLGTGKEEDKNEIFYGKFLPLYDSLSEIDRLYDKVRNYITQKPYSKDKIKLNFENPQLLGGWDKNKEKDYRTVLLIKDGNYYLAIMDKINNKSFINLPEYSDGEFYDKVEYKLLPGPNKMLPKVFFASSNLDKFTPSAEIIEIRRKESFKKGDNFNLSDCHKFIDFFKESIKKHEDWSNFGFEFSPTESYKDISEFYREVQTQGYGLNFKKIPAEYIDSLIEKGELYLFKIYNKDFSEHSHGNQNLHTMYFKMLFDKENLKNVVYQLNGGAEMFYRQPSIKDNEKVVHPANQPVKNKNEDNLKKESLFNYDIIKDKRFTERQFSLHIPITLNFNAKGQNRINNDVRKSLKNCDENYVIGIDRGERNLLYICVINQKGEIVEQKSLNEIVGNNGYKVDYHKLLDKKETERDTARKNWTSVENIKELKEGYLSQVIHEICNLVLKYDAVIAMEDLNFGFKNGRFKVEKQVYQKFENMLITKLNYLVSKNIKPESAGGLLNAYQLTNKVDGINKARQNGFIFYVPAWLTSKIDPVTGFADLLRPKYNGLKDAQEFVNQIDDIRYNRNENIFEFDIDYSKFAKCNAAYIKKWTICSNSDRIITFRNPDKNNQWDNRTVVLSEEFKQLFEKYNIDYTANLKDKILQINKSDFYKDFIRLLALCLQMRNSITGDTSVDYLISPVKNNDGQFYDSRNYINSEARLPQNADANGAYNIARKALWAIDVLKQTDDELLDKANLSITNAQWLEFVQK